MRLGVGDEDGRTARGESQRVLRLMVLRHIRRGDEDRRLAEVAELGDGARPSTRYDDVRQRVGQIHTLDEGRAVDGEAVAREQLLCLVGKACPRLPDEGCTRLLPFLQSRADSLVDAARTEAAAYDEHHLLGVGRQAEVLQRLCTRRAELLDGGANRVARQDDLILGEEALHLGIGDADLRRPPREELIRHARIGVLLLDERRDAEALSGLERRGTGIAPHADDDLGLELTDEVAGRDERTEEVLEHAEVSPDALAIQPSYV